MKPRPISIAWARGRASKPPASLIAWWASAMSWPSPLASARARYALASARHDVALEHEVGRAFVGLGHLLRHLGDPPARRHATVAGVGREPAGEQGEQRRLAGAVAADQADLLAGVDGDAGAVEHELDAAAQRDSWERTSMPRFSPQASRRARRPFVRPRRGSGTERAALDQDDRVFAGARLQPGAFEARKGGLEVRRARGRPRAPARASSLRWSGASATMRRIRSMPSLPPASASAGSARYSAGSARMLSLVDVRRVAEDQVVASAARRRTGRTRATRIRDPSPCRATLMRASASASALMSAASTSISG